MDMQVIEMKRAECAKISTRKFRGISTVEMIAGLVVLIPIILTLFDLGCIISGVLVNDTVCRDIARAVSESDPASAKQRAEQLVVQANKKSGSVVSQYSLVGDPQNADLVVPAPEVGGLVKGTVTVRTRVEIRPPFLVGVVYGGQGLNFDSQQTFPYTFSMPAKGEDPN